jgi:hypothetical protein
MFQTIDCLKNETRSANKIPDKRVNNVVAFVKEIFLSYENLSKFHTIPTGHPEQVTFLNSYLCQSQILLRFQIFLQIEI